MVFIIAFHGKPAVGKSTACQHLLNCYGEDDVEIWDSIPYLNSTVEFDPERGLHEDHGQHQGVMRHGFHHLNQHATHRQVRPARAAFGLGNPWPDPDRCRRADAVETARRTL